MILLEVYCFSLFFKIYFVLFYFYNPKLSFSQCPSDGKNIEEEIKFF